ncbi:hypothetical protein CPB83DRAFT_909426 [Crepidotus variabilis]|uniref:F-box domain-containing protein n=1 Tax=Crepidotus variabilis TaxID=179855 RepID=A0A9P6E9Y6_9AGAR|nr:hypothetical protein CPB83DRAFT_909426 [Crepidotus variabilis]
MSSGCDTSWRESRVQPGFAPRTPTELGRTYSMSRFCMKSEASSNLLEFNPDLEEEKPLDINISAPVASSSKIKLEATVKPRGKKRKGSADDLTVTKPLQKRPKKKHGVIKKFEEIPIEILLEIFVLVDPADLLSLARTTKSIRSILMDKKTLSLWKTSFRNMELSLPECPDDLSEPVYAALAFDKPCSYCGRDNITVYIAWACRLRVCTKCLEPHFTEHLKDLGYGYGSSTAKFVTSFRAMRGKLGSRTPHKEYFWKDKDREWEAEYAKLEHADERQAWSKEKKVQSLVLKKHNQLCETWATARDRLFAKDRNSLVKDRESLVLDHVRKMGWGEDLDKISGTSNAIQKLDEVKKACQKSLTARALQTLEPVLTKHMMRLRRDHLDHQNADNLRELLVVLHDTYSEYLASFPPKFGYATTGDIYRLPIIRDIIDDCLPSKSLETRFEQLQAAFPEVQTAWRASVRTQLLTMIELTCASEPQKIDPEAVLDEASTLLRCSNCRHNVPVKDAHIHPCAYGDWYGKNSIKDTYWNCRYFSFELSVVNKYSDGLKSLGYDPKCVTVHRLNQENPIIECLLCHSEVSGRCTMLLNTLASHLQSHNDAKPVHGVHQYLRLVEEPQATAVRSRIGEVVEMAFASSYNKRTAMCKCCRRLDRYVTLLDHVRIEHCITRPKLGEDIIANPSFSHEYMHRLWPPLHKEDVELLLATKSDSCDICQSDPSSVVKIE